MQSVLLGRNLASALRHLRYQDKPRTLWVDAGYINQRGDVEKSLQVGRTRYSIQVSVVRDRVAWA